MPQVIDNEMELEGKSPEELDAMLDEAVNGKTEPEGEKPQEPEKPAQDDVSKRLAELEEANKRLEKQVQDKEAFITQRNAEIGMLRKKARQAAPDIETTVKPDEFVADPVAATKKLLREVRDKEAETQEEDAKIAAETREAVKTAIYKWDKDFDKSAPEMVEFMKNDGAPEEILTQFQKDPIGTFAPPVLFQMLKRLAMAREIRDLKAKLADAEKRPSELAHKVQAASRGKPVVSSAPATSKAAKSLEELTEDDIDRMSPEEIEKLNVELERRHRKR